MRLLFTALAFLFSVSVFGQDLSFFHSYKYIVIEQVNGNPVWGASNEPYKFLTKYLKSANFNLVDHNEISLYEDLSNNRNLALYCYSNMSETLGGFKVFIVFKDSNGNVLYETSATSGFLLSSAYKKAILPLNNIFYQFNPNSKPTISSNSNNGWQANDNKKESSLRIRVSEAVTNISKVAVIGKEASICDGSQDDGSGLAELVEGELLGIYGVVERRHLEEILDEQRLAMSGLLLEDSDFAQAGCLAGAQGTVLASYGCLQGQTKLQVKLVDCSTSDLYWSATGLDVSAFDLMDALRIELSK